MVERIIRTLLMAVGVALGAYGVSMLWDVSVPDKVSIGSWLVVGLLAHDAVFAPMVLVASWLLRRWIPQRWRRPVLIALAYTNVVVLLAFPVILPRSTAQRPSNPTILDRNYALGLTVAIVIIWATVFAGEVLLGTRRAGKRRRVSDSSAADSTRPVSPPAQS